MPFFFIREDFIHVPKKLYPNHLYETARKYTPDSAFSFSNPLACNILGAKTGTFQSYAGMAQLY